MFFVLQGQGQDLLEEEAITERRTGETNGRALIRRG